MRARVAVFMGVVAIAIAGCGDDEDDDATGAATTTDTAAAEADALQEEIADLSDEEQIERVGAAWAEPFAKGDEAMCDYLHPDIAGGCAQYTEGALTQSVRIQRSYADARVESVDVRGQSAVAEFSNGDRVTFEQDPEGAWKVIEVAN